MELTLEKTTLQRYPAYKDSGVEWLGEIPEHWEVKPLKSVAKIKSICNFSDLNLLSVYLDKGVIKFNEIEAKRTNVTSLDLSKYQLVEKGDFVINNQQAWRGSVGVSNYKGIISPAYIILSLSNYFDFDFANYYFRNYSILSQYVISSKGVGTIQRNLYWPQLKGTYVSFPTVKEQAAIANFLDNKTTKIDQAIGIKQKQIELLKERRQILIHKTVTRGLDENVKLKDSGVEWIGEIPEHWEVKKLFGLCNFIRGNSTFSKDELLSSGNYVALQYGKTYKVDEVNDSYSFYVNDEFYKETQIVRYDDTILISTSETIEDLGHSAYYNRNDIGLIGGEQILLNPKNNKLNGHYLYYYSKQFAKELRKYATGIKVYRFNVNNLKTIYISIPPIFEQIEIAKFIETATTKIATAISLKDQEIEKLKEYKMSLIDGVVTGKVKVS